MLFLAVLYPVALTCTMQQLTYSAGRRPCGAGCSTKSAQAVY